ncbi:MAG TPA: ABC transporter permease [Vicinamibacterales bacterium]|jgi:putative ABC transport system permease protein|nr:ABC transporter permease [Vicinamibacterales bacterium]
MFSQIIAVTGVNLRSIRARLGSSSVAVIGIAGVVLVFVAVLSIAEGVAATMKASGDPDTVMILRAGSDTEMTSGLAGDSVRIIQDAPGVARDGTGTPLTSPELFVVVDHPLKRSGSAANVPLRGVTPEAFKVHDKLRIVEGRNFEFGKNEVIAGKAAQRQFVGLDVGTPLKWGQNTWTLVGIFDDGGSVAESEIWCDVKVLQPAYRRGNSYQSVYAKLASADSYQQLKDSLTSNPQLTVSAMRAPEYYASQTETLQTIIKTIGGIIAVLMGVGAIFGAVITMYTAVASRTREIATLRALGFGSFPVVVSVIVEASCLAVIGGLIGGLVAYAAFNGYETATMNFQSFSQMAFRFAVTPQLLGTALFYALLMGILGGLLPAIRAARLPVVTALREL